MSHLGAKKATILNLISYYDSRVLSLVSPISVIAAHPCLWMMSWDPICCVHIPKKRVVALSSFASRQALSPTL